MNQLRLLNILEKILGPSNQLKNEEAVFHCPFCSHHKKKMQVSLNTNRWHCWVCGKGGRRIITLLTKVSAPKELIKEVLILTKDYSSYNTDKDETKYLISLPSEFKPLWLKSDNLIYKHAIKYLRTRDIRVREILRYGIGYCESGPYSNRVIIPSYDMSGKLNYFVGRDIFPESKFKYKNPQISKNIVPFELYINWNKPLIICEGVFDAIAIKKNAIPLLGKFLSKELVKTIITNGVKQVYIALDSDARSDAVKLSKFFMNYGISVYLMTMDEKDPSNLGFENFWKLIEDIPQLSLSSLIQEQLYAN
jgi:DNA primase